MTEVEKKPRARRKKVVTELSPATSLIEALKFVLPCQKKFGPPMQQFCVIRNHKLIASNEILTIGTPVEEDLFARPHTVQLLDALGKVGNELSITQLTSETLCIASGSFKALVPCDHLDSFEITQPDENVAQIDDKIKESLAAVCGLAVEGATYAHFAGVLLQANSAVATNGKVLMEAWHGINLPTMLIPRASVNAIVKTKKALSGFGYSGSSATFWFEDGSFIKTQLFAEKFPNYKPILDVEIGNTITVPNEFFDAIKCLIPFSKNGLMYINKNRIATDSLDTNASTYEFEGLPENICFTADLMLLVEEWFDRVYFQLSDIPKALFFKGNVRGCISLVEVKVQNKNDYQDFDGDIPF